MEKSVEEKIQEFVNVLIEDYGTVLREIEVNMLRTLLRQTSQERGREIVETVLPYLKGYLNTLDCDWSVNPVQAVHAIYIPPEQALRNSANEIEAKRERAKQLRQLIESLTNPNKD